jgi:C-terminal processing protease CtpA/Prc
MRSCSSPPRRRCGLAAPAPLLCALLILSACSSIPFLQPAPELPPGPSGVIVDLRWNDGGAPLYLAGYLSMQPIPLAQLEYFSDASGRFEPDGERDQVEPIEDPYRFEKLAVLVDQGCYSACELEAYGFSKLPGAIVVGQYPSAGVGAEVSRGQYWLPEDIYLQVPTGRYVMPDGALFLEGAGVVPTLRVPVDARSVLEEDVVLEAAEQALLK